MEVHVHGMEEGLETEAQQVARAKQDGQVTRVKLMGLKTISVKLKTTMAEQMTITADHHS